MAKEISTETRNGVLTIAFNRPDCGNALSLDMANQIFQAVKLVATDRAIRAVVLKGANRHFMDGLDLRMYARDFTAGIERNNEMFPSYHSAIRELHVMDKPVLSVVTGRVAGPGFSFVLASDLVLAGRSAEFSAGFTSYAMTPDGATSFFLPRKVGAAKALEILMLGDSFDAAAAQRLNLVNAVVDDAELDAKAAEWSARLAEGPTKAYGGIKRLVSKAFEQDINAHMGLEHAYWGSTTRTFDYRSAIKGRLAKTPVKYTGS